MFQPLKMARLRKTAPRLAGSALAALLVALAAIAIVSPAVAGAGAAAWQRTQLGGPGAKVYLLSASCPSTSLCVVAGTNNLIAVSTDPNGGPWSYGYAGEGAWPETENWPTEAISGNPIQAVSCPSTRLCVAVSGTGYIYSTDDPTAAPSTWATTRIAGEGGNAHLYGISCPSVSLCVAVSGKRTDHGHILTSTDPTAKPPVWRSIELGEPIELRAVSCGTPTSCVAVAEDGRVVVSSDPTGDASAWQVIGSPGGPGSLRAISCLTTILCLSGNESGSILTTGNPGGGIEGWKKTQGGGSVQITGAACASASKCLLVDNNGDVLGSSNPGAGSADWSFENIVPYTEAEGNALFGAACPSVSLCLVSGSRGQIFTSSDPFTEAARPTTQTGQRRRMAKRPHTKIATVRTPRAKQLERHRGRVMIRFYAPGGARGFLCKFDAGKFRPCRSPKRYRIRVGRHLFQVRAIGSTGLRGPVTREPIVVYPLCNVVLPRPGMCTA